MPSMPLSAVGPVQIIVADDQWPDDFRASVRANLLGEVSGSLDDMGPNARGEAVLVVTRPVLFASGALGRIRRLAADPERVVTRVLVPGEEVTAVALWSGAWLRDRGIDPATLSRAGLDFDRDWLPHDIPNVRAWVRAEDIGVVRCQPGTGGRRWVLLEGARLALRGGIDAMRAVLGRVRRQRSLASQRRQMQAD